MNLKISNRTIMNQNNQQKLKLKFTEKICLRKTVLSLCHQPPKTKGIINDSILRMLAYGLAALTDRYCVRQRPAPCRRAVRVYLCIICKITTNQ